MLDALKKELAAMIRADARYDELTDAAVSGIVDSVVTATSDRLCAEMDVEYMHGLGADVSAPPGLLAALAGADAGVYSPLDVMAKAYRVNHNWPISDGLLARCERQHNSEEDAR